MFVGRKGRFFLMLCLPPWYSLASLVSGRPAAFFLFRKLLGTSQGRDLRRGGSRDEGNKCFLSSSLGESWLGPQLGGDRVPRSTRGPPPPTYVRGSRKWREGEISTIKRGDVQSREEERKAAWCGAVGLMLLLSVRNGVSSPSSSSSDVRLHVPKPPPPHISAE